MKIDLDNIRLSVTAITNKVVVGVLDKSGKRFLHKKEIDNDFLHAVVTRFEGCTEVISNGEGTYEITVKRIK